ncbi:hypothetical protein, partial [Segatella salivae]|uniref:hypothetical protein n=1 Tax=Segatella salivae TaxID=228604 RepID=UPI00241FAC2E
ITYMQFMHRAYSMSFKLFPSGLAFPRLAKVVSRVVWHFRARRKSFPEGFGISAPGESHFPSDLTRARIVYL